MQRKAVLITGASGGIGQALASVFFQAGYDLCLHYFKSEKKIKSFIQSLEKNNTFSPEKKPHIYSFSLDLSQNHQAEILIEKSKLLLGRAADVLIFNAGLSEISPLQDLSPQKYSQLHHLFLQNPLFACQKALPDFLEKGQGQVIFISSIWGLCGASCEVAYSSLKAAQHGLVKALAQEWGPSHIGVYAIACGIIDTEMNQHLSLEEKEKLIEMIPLGRFGTPREVAELALFLSSEKARYLTGQIISPNGAFYC